METVVLLTILGIAVFLGGAYFMGNFMLCGFHDSLQTRIANTAYGILCWILIGFVVLVCWGIYEFIIWFMPVSPSQEWLSK